MLAESIHSAWRSEQRLSISDLHHAYRSGKLAPSDYLRLVLARIDAVARDEIWITRVAPSELLALAARLDAMLAAEGPAVLDVFPVFGVPFAVKDNIDVAGLATTAACPEFTYWPAQSAHVVERLGDHHALLLGKTNLDQFATGLAGTRSPYGVVRNAVDPDYIAGGSSAGSAVAVALGLVGFALGTDTAGSGRVPAGLNGVVGLKPSHGLVSNTGVLPACRTLDCVAVFANHVADAWRVLQILAGVDSVDPYSRQRLMLPALARPAILGIPSACEFFNDAAAERAFAQTLDTLCSADFYRLKCVDITPLFTAGELLYRGPWVAERRAAFNAFFDRHPDAFDPAVRATIAEAGIYHAVDVFLAEYRRVEYCRYAAELFETVDVLMVPTTARHPRIDETLRDSMTVTHQLARYTNFVNLLDLAAIAIPTTPRGDRLPAGVTLIGPAGSDHRLAVLGAELAARFGHELPTAAADLAVTPLPFQETTTRIAVVGDKWNGRLISCGARRLGTTQTASGYRTLADADTPDGLILATHLGVALAVELWELPLRNFGNFIEQLPPTRSVGWLTLGNGERVHGCLCEPMTAAHTGNVTKL